MIPEHQTVYDILSNFVKENGAYKAAFGTNIDVTYVQLVEDIDSVTRYLIAEGVKAGDCVCVIMDPTYSHMIFLLALDRLGATSGSYNFPAKTLMPQLWWHHVGYHYVFSEEKRSEEFRGKWVTVAELPRIAQSSNAEELPIDRSPDRVVRFLSSSGTTGTPKVVEVTREMLHKRISYTPFYEHRAGEGRHFIGMPMDNAGGYTSVIMALVYGCAVIVWNNSEDFLKLINKYKPNYLLLTPMTLRSIVVDGVQNNYTLDFVELVYSGGMIFDRRLIASCEAVFGDRVYNGYGSTEAWCPATGRISEYDGDSPHLIGDVMPEVEVQIVDENDQVVSVGETGAVRIKSDYVIQGYKDGDSAQNFKEGYFYPGDLGMLDGKNRLSILGRVDDLINIGGQKIIPEPIEYEIDVLPEVKESAVFQVITDEGARVCVAIVLNVGQASPEYHNVIIKKIQSRLDRLTPPRIFFVSELPRNGMGKIMRRDLAKALVK